jgi:polygalacturonase
MRDRRFVLASAAAFAALPAHAADNDPFAGMAAILARIRPPVFAARDFPVTGFGARQGRDCTQAFAAAIKACNAAGGGRVLVPDGVWQTGAIHLLSNVNLHLADNAAIAFDRDPRRYPIVRTFWEGNEAMNYSPFVYAFGQDNIAITGKGTLDGQADPDHWWNWKRKTLGTDVTARNRLQEMAEKNVPVASRVFGDGHYLRPNFIQPFRCRNVLIEGVTLKRSPMWQVHPVLSSNVIVRGLTIVADGPNTDGCDPEFCRDVLIEDCHFDTGDDCIAIKSGRNADGRRIHLPTENVIIRRCRMKNGHGGVTLGSEISGGVRNVFVEDCRMDSPRLDYALRLKDNAMRGGVLEHVYVRRVTVGQVGVAVLTVDFNYEEGPRGPFTPVVRDVLIQDMTVTGKVPRVADLQGFANSRIENIVLRDCRFANAAGASIIHNVSGLVLDNVTVNGTRMSSL